MLRQGLQFLTFTMLFGVSIFVLGSDQVPQKLASEVPKEFKDVGITEHMSAQVNRDLTFTDEDGKSVTLGSFFDGKRPVILGLVYYGCPNLCNFFLNGVVDSFKNLEWQPGREFQFIAVSIDPSEKSSLAKEKKANLLKEYGRAGTENGWHFLTGNEANIKELAKEVGFGYKWDASTKQWAHVAAGIVLTPQAQVARYLYGIMFDVKTLRWTLIEASRNQIGGFVDRVLLYCFKFDANSHKYSFYSYNLMRAAGALTVVLMGLFFVPFWRRNWSNNQGDGTV